MNPVKKICLLFFLLTISFKAFNEEPEKSTSKKSNLGANLSINNGLGIATFLDAEKRDPKFYSSFNLSPFLKTNPYWQDKIIKFYTEVKINVDWLDSSATSATNPSRTPTVSDLKLRAFFGNLFQNKEFGLSISPGLKIEIPTSRSSRVSNRTIALGTNTAFMLSKWNLYFLYKPSITAYFHSQNYKSDICGAPSTIKNQNRLKSGLCKAKGRQTLALLKNGFFVGYTPKNHSVTIGFRAYHSFLRKSPEKESVMFNTLGLVEYKYNINMKVPMSAYLGLSSYQEAFDENGSINFPFFDFKKPSSNNTEVYFGIGLTI